MPTFPLTVTAPTAIANLVRDYSIRVQGGVTPAPLTPLQFFQEECRKLALHMALTEYQWQKSEQVDPDAPVDSDVTVS